LILLPPHGPSFATLRPCSPSELATQFATLSRLLRLASLFVGDASAQEPAQGFRVDVDGLLPTSAYEGVTEKLAERFLRARRYNGHSPVPKPLRVAFPKSPCRRFGFSKESGKADGLDKM
jgi:hypothetical protein